MRNVEPTAGGSPPGRNSRRVGRIASNRTWLSTVCWWKVSSTTKPRSARLAAGRSDWARVRVPHRSSAALPGGGGAGHADRDAAGDQLRGEVVGLAGLGVDEGVARHRLRRGLPAVDGAHLAGLGVVVDEEAAAADAGAVGLGDAERRGGRDGRVDGVAAVAQHPQPDPGGVGVDGATRRRRDRRRSASWVARRPRVRAGAPLRRTRRRAGPARAGTGRRATRPGSRVRRGAWVLPRTDVIPERFPPNTRSPTSVEPGSGDQPPRGPFTAYLAQTKAPLRSSSVSSRSNLRGNSGRPAPRVTGAM